MERCRMTLPFLSWFCWVSWRVWEETGGALEEVWAGDADAKSAMSMAERANGRRNSLMARFFPLSCLLPRSRAKALLVPGFGRRCFAFVPGFCPVLVAALAVGFIKDNGSGGGDVERAYAPGHGNTQQVVAGAADEIVQAVAFA